MKADVNVIDYDALTIHPPEMVYDLPAGGKRMVQRTQGYDATIVAGQVVVRNCEHTGQRPGEVIREFQRG